MTIAMMSIVEKPVEVSDEIRLQTRKRPASTATTETGNTARVSFDGMLPCFVADLGRLLPAFCDAIRVDDTHGAG
jgi:hypothetical protein